MKKLDNWITLIIVFISTAVFPNLLLYILQIDFNVAIGAAFVSAVTLVILSLIQQNLALKKAKNRNNTDALMKRYNTVRIYAINGRYWADIMQANPKLEATNCIILIRKHIDGLCDKTRYIQETQESINLWREFKKEGRIGNLTIYEYTHIPDHYFAILDKKVLITGLNDLCTLDSTGQLGDRDAKLVFSPDDKRLIAKYIHHFDNYVEHYKENQLQL